MRVKALVFLLIFLVAVPAITAKTVELVIYSSESGYMSQRQPHTSFDSLEKEKAPMIFFGTSGKKSASSYVHYEWFDISSIPLDAEVISAQLYKYHDSSRLGKDISFLMKPRYLSGGHRVQVAKLLEPFSPFDSFASEGSYKKQQLLGAVDSVSAGDTVLVYDVRRTVQEWVSGEPNYGFSFLGNYNNLYRSTSYYFSNSAYKPMLVIKYSTQDSVGDVCGNGVAGDKEQCDSADLKGKSCISMGFSAGTLACTSACAFDTTRCSSYRCGNGLVEAGEQCDDGNPVNTDACLFTCKVAKCGDSYVRSGVEACDDGNVVGGDGCSAACQLEPSAVCGNGVVELGEECDDSNLVSGDGCSSSCKTEAANKIYVVSYVGDIDGSYSEDWVLFYSVLADFYQSNNIPAAFSFYPGTMSQEEEFVTAFKKLYIDPNIELLQKGYMGNELEKRMDTLSFEEQKGIIKSGQDAFKRGMAGMGIGNAALPVSYNQINGRFTETTRRAAQELGFIMYFDVFVEPDLNAVSSTKDFDVVQYGVSFTKDGDTGKDSVFKSQSEIIQEVKGFKAGQYSLLIGESPVVPLWVHQQDFESRTSSNAVDSSKWSAYMSTIIALKQDTNIVFITPKQAYFLKRQIAAPVCGNKILEAGEQCDDGNVVSGDGCSAVCTVEQANAVCGNGVVELGEECDDSNLVSGDGCSSSCKTEQPSESVCIFATSASATSENVLGSLAVNALGAPDAKISGCGLGQWSGYGYSWTPSSWNMKATLTLKYDFPVYVSKLTVFGDYDICWDRVWIKNSQTGKELLVMSGPDSSCVLTKLLQEDFAADTVVLETCGWSWSSTDAVELCGKKLSSPGVTGAKICTWKSCEKGAASISVDDSFTSCMDTLESYGFRGTFFLSNTDKLSAEQWVRFNSAFIKGHEIGTHTRNHPCYDAPNFVEEVELNIQDIVANTDVRRESIVSHAHPCGFFTQSSINSLKSNWNFIAARGYNYNQLESSSYPNFFDLKSYNSHGYPGGSLEPPSYTEAVNSAEREGKWLNLVFHNECNDDGAIAHLASKSMWVDTIGNVAKYMQARQNAEITGYSASLTESRFEVVPKGSLPYSTTLTIQAEAAKKPQSVTVNGQPVSYTWLSGYVMFDVQSASRSEVKITFS